MMGNSSTTQIAFSFILGSILYFQNLRTLRDYLAEFIAQHVLKSYLKHSDAYISKMASLAKELRREQNIEHPLVQEILRLTDNDSGWLAQMSAYRDLLIHHAPAGMVEGRAFTMHRVITLADGATLPAVAFYLPAKPHDIKRARARGGQFITFEDWAAASTQRSPEKGLEALRYCHLLVGQMTVLAIAVADYSPVRPTMMTFLESRAAIVS